MTIGLPELLIVLVVVLLIVGPRRLPALGRQLGGGFRELRSSLKKRHDEVDAADRSDDGGASDRPKRD